MKASYNDLEFVIEDDLPNVGVYLYVYQNGKCIRDYLQNDKAACIEIALEDYGVPRDLWRPVEGDSNALQQPLQG